MYRCASCCSRCIRFTKSQRKYLLELKLVSLYDKIELHILKTRSHLTNIDLKFLNVNKTIAVNPQFLDIEFIIAINHLIKEKNIKGDSTWYNEYVDKEDEYLKLLLLEYSKTQVDLSFLSALKIEYIIKGVWIRIFNIITNKTFNLSELFRSKIDHALYSGNNISKLAGC